MSETGEQVRNGDDNAGLSSESAALLDDSGTSASANGSAMVPYRSDSTASRGVPALAGVRIPGKQPTTIRRRIRQVYQHHPWLGAGDLNAVLRYVRIMDRFLRKCQYLDKLPPVRPEGNDVAPRKLDADLRADSAELTKLEDRLGLTSRSRAELGIDIQRIDLARAMSGQSDG